MDELDIVPARRDDWLEVQNYIQALNDAISQLQTLPLSSRLIRDTHHILMQSVRGRHKQPGEFRTSQKLDRHGSENTIFVPPNHESPSELMSDLEKFMHNEEIHVPHLVKIGIIHYQFETIHPFLDGNGAVLIVLSTWSASVACQTGPVSVFFL